MTFRGGSPVSPCKVCGFPILQNWIYERNTCDSCWDWSDRQVAEHKQRARDREKRSG